MEQGHGNGSMGIEPLGQIRGDRSMVRHGTKKWDRDMGQEHETGTWARDMGQGYGAWNKGMGTGTWGQRRGDRDMG